MFVPENHTEDEVLAIIDKIVATLAERFRFGYYGIEDVKQEGRMAALEALPRYDVARPLENFLYVHVRNRLFNLRRKKLTRFETPCTGCPFYDPKMLKSSNKCSLFVDKMECDKYNAWNKRNSSKANIMEPTGISDVTVNEKSVQQQSEVVDTANVRDILSRIDQSLPMSLRSDYLKMQAGVSVPKPRRLKVEAACKRIITGVLNGEEGQTEH